jgi:hypothetical protein
MIPGMEKILLSWSSRKDSAWALHVLRANPEVEVVGLLTTINRQAGRVAMHAVRERNRSNVGDDTVKPKRASLRTPSCHQTPIEGKAR